MVLMDWQFGHPGSGVLILDTQPGGCGALLSSIKSVPDPVELELRGLGNNFLILFCFQY